MMDLFLCNWFCFFASDLELDATGLTGSHPLFNCICPPSVPPFCFPESTTSLQLADFWVHPLPVRQHRGHTVDASAAV